MITAIDTNVIVGLWNPDDALNPLARRALDSVYGAGGLVICGAVFGELLACPGRTEQFVHEFIKDVKISVDWSNTEDIWRKASSAFQKYAARRRRQKLSDARRILTDFYIGAHALSSGCQLLTMDDRIYHKAFPGLHVIRS